MKLTEFRIAFYKAKYGDKLDKTIQMLTCSPYSHCEIVYPDGICASASPRDGGVRLVQIYLGEHWDVFDFKIPLDEDKIMDYFREHNGKPYDYVGALGSAVGLRAYSKDRKFCSLACAEALGLKKINLTPGGLFNELRRLKFI